MANEVFWFRVTGSVLKFDGFLRVYEESKEGKDEEDEELKHKLPALEAGQKLTLKELKPEQHFTEPPPRYNEASLVKELEERGIGRPSTYAAILTHHSGAAVRAESRWESSLRPRLAWSSPICWWKTSATFSTCSTPRTWKKNSTDRRRQRDVAGHSRRLLQEVPERSQICRKAYGEHQADGEAHGREV